MDYGTFCTGIGAPEVAFNRLGWTCKFQSEINSFCNKVLKHHYPHVPNLGDMSLLPENKIFNESNVNLWVAGTPCQSFSIAGLRGGMDDQRGNLSLTFCKLLLRKQPPWFLWENVPGVFSSFSDDADGEIIINNIDNTRTVRQCSDFATLLQGFQECGYSVAWRVLDSQYFGVPQRRRRVFVVGYLGTDWRPPFAVLFERDSLQRDITPFREEREEVTGTITSGTDRGNPGTIVARTITASSGRTRGGIDPGSIVPFRLSNRSLYVNDETASALKERDWKSATDLIWSSIDCRNDRVNEEISGTIQSKSGHGGPSLNYINGTMVRRLTPLECERLQGFPDHYTNIPGASDSNRYSAIGNSMTTFVIEWIGKRIKMVDNIIKKNS